MNSEGELVVEEDGDGDGEHDSINNDEFLLQITGKPSAITQYAKSIAEGISELIAQVQVLKDSLEDVQDIRNILNVETAVSDALLTMIHSAQLGKREKGENGIMYYLFICIIITIIIFFNFIIYCLFVIYFVIDLFIFFFVYQPL